MKAGCPFTTMALALRAAERTLVRQERGNFRHSRPLSAPVTTAARSSLRLNRGSARSARARGGLECEPHFRPKPVLGFARFDGPNEACHRGKTHASTRLTVRPYERRVRDGSGLLGSCAGPLDHFLTSSGQVFGCVARSPALSMSMKATTFRDRCRGVGYSA